MISLYAFACVACALSRSVSVSLLMLSFISRTLPNECVLQCLCVCSFLRSFLFNVNTSTVFSPRVTLYNEFVLLENEKNNNNFSHTILAWVDALRCIAYIDKFITHPSIDVGWEEQRRKTRRFLTRLDNDDGMIFFPLNSAIVVRCA